MKKYTLFILLITALLTVAGSVQARDYNNHQRSNHYRGDSHRYSQYSSGYNRHRRHNNRHELRKGLKVAAGVLVLGSVIHAIANNNRRYDSRSSSSVRVDPQPYPNTRQDYWYRIDSEGQCVEVKLNQYGQEVWTDTDNAYCR